MDSDITAIVILIVYALAAIAVMARQVARCQDGWQLWVLYVVARLYVPLMFHWRSNRRCPFPVGSPALIIANHRSPADPLLIWLNTHLVDHGTTGIRLVSWLTAREYFEKPGFIGWICRHKQCIPTERDGKDMGATREALRRLKDGRLVGVFPEGRINTGQVLLDANPGIAFLALKARVPVYPVFVHNSPQADSMMACFYTVSRVRLVYGDPIDLSEFYDQRTTHELLQHVTDVLMRRLAELGGLTVADRDGQSDDRTLRLLTG